MKFRMNNNLRELVANAGAYTDVSGRWISSSGLQKFAEMIVRECMRRVEEQYKPVMEDEAMMKDTHWDGYVQCGVDSYVAIREHFFGVEE